MNGRADTGTAREPGYACAAPNVPKAAGTVEPFLRFTLHCSVLAVQYCSMAECHHHPLPVPDIGSEVAKLYAASETSLIPFH